MRNSTWYNGDDFKILTRRPATRAAAPSASLRLSALFPPEIRPPQRLTKVNAKTPQRMHARAHKACVPLASGAFRTLAATALPSAPRAVPGCTISLRRCNVTPLHCCTVWTFTLLRAARMVAAHGIRWHTLARVERWMLNVACCTPTARTLGSERCASGTALHAALHVARCAVLHVESRLVGLELRRSPPDLLLLAPELRRSRWQH
jgi:hypothetical protein